MIKRLVARLAFFASTAKRVTGIILVYITIAGLYTFTAFILEESLQCVTWASWGIERMGNYAALKSAHDTMLRINHTLASLNSWLGWLNPIAKISYRAYHDATEHYLESMRLKIIATAPELFADQSVTFTFTPLQKRFDPVSKVYSYTNSKLRVSSKSELTLGSPYRITAMVTCDAKQVVLTIKD